MPNQHVIPTLPLAEDFMFLCTILTNCWPLHVCKNVCRYLEGFHPNLVKQYFALYPVIKNLHSTRPLHYIFEVFWFIFCTLGIKAKPKMSMATLTSLIVLNSGVNKCGSVFQRHVDISIVFKHKEAKCINITRSSQFMYNRVVDAKRKRWQHGIVGNDSGGVLWVREGSWCWRRWEFYTRCITRTCFTCKTENHP